ncbi:MAG TPA: HAD-IC family P-type ATPase [Dehalococcoidia bacterium]|nr:HAD-IC family P-type ATPase [Dehalococcoidia bacterium]
MKTAADNPPLFRGLTEAEAAERKARGQSNVYVSSTSRSYGTIIRQNALTPINITLFSICIGLMVLRLFGDAAMTASLVVANVVLGAFQEIRAKRKLDQISLLTRPTATVIRNEKERVVPPDEIVLGDLLLVNAGDQFLVDGEVFSSNSLIVDESLLTGESDVIPKQPGDPVYSGSFCMGGAGTYVARKVGKDSLAQTLTEQAREFRNVQTPLQREVGLVLRVMAVVVVALGVQVVVGNSLSLKENVRAAAVLASLVPQGLSFMVTVTYAMAVVRMAGSGALIQRINAVESTSNVDLLCMDKTGTLTTNQLALEALEPIPPQEESQVRAALGSFAHSSSVDNRTIEAIREACLGEALPVREEVPFSSELKWSALASGAAIYALGAPEVLQQALEPGSDVSRKVAPWAERGMRVLLFASAPASSGLRNGSGEPRLPASLKPLALVVLRDELRPAVKETLDHFARAGIGLKIISGDNPETVAALARQAGFPADLTAVSGLELNGMSDRELERVAESATVFGRVAPQLKERLIRALRHRRHYVAMIGDGVNDVLALKQANLSIAMRGGAQVTSNIADMVLFDNSFATLPKAFLEGQRIRRGMTDIIRLFLVRTLYVALIIFGTSLFAHAFPTTPRQNGVLAFLTVGIPTLALAAWARPGTTPRQLVLSSGRFVVPAAISIAWVGLMVYEFYISTGGEVIAARSALTTVTVLCGLILIPFAQPPHPALVGGAPLNGDWRPTILAGLLLVLYVVILALPTLRDFFELEVLSLPEYAIIVHVVISWAVILRAFWRIDPRPVLQTLRRS